MSDANKTSCNLQSAPAGESFDVELSSSESNPAVVDMNSCKALTTSTAAMPAIAKSDVNTTDEVILLARDSSVIKDKSMAMTSGGVCSKVADDIKRTELLEATKNDTNTIDAIAIIDEETVAMPTQHVLASNIDNTTVDSTPCGHMKFTSSGSSVIKAEHNTSVVVDATVTDNCRDGVGPASAALELEPGKESTEPAKMQSFKEIQSAAAASNSSSSESASSDDESIADCLKSEDENDEGVKNQKGIVTHVKMGPLVPGELTIYDLPPIKDLTINIDENVVLCELGTVMSIVDCLAVIKAKPGTDALDEGTVLFAKGRRSVGEVFETFGPVISPFYSIRFNSVEDIIASQLKVGDEIFFAPKEEKSLTTYVFVNRLQETIGSDASWLQNHEPPPKHIDYSDDEQERQAKAKHKAKNRRSDAAESLVNADDPETPEANHSLQKKGRSTSHRTALKNTNSSVKPPRCEVRPAGGGYGQKPAGGGHGQPGPFAGPPGRGGSRGPPPHHTPWSVDPAHHMPRFPPPHPTHYPPPPAYYGQWGPPPSYAPQWGPPGQPPTFGYPPPMFTPGWQSYGGAWTEQDGDYYSEAPKKPAGTFVDTRFVQQADFKPKADATEQPSN